MAILTKLSLEQAREIGRLYGVEVDDIRPVLAGSVNSNFELVTKERRLFLRLYEEQTSVTAAREAALLSHLSHEGVPTPEPLNRIDGRGFIAEAAGRPAAIFPFREGEMICQRGVTRGMAWEVGRALGAIHRAGAALTPERLAELAGESRFDRPALEERLRRVAAISTTAEIRETVAEIGSFLAEPATSPRVTGLIHGDVFRDNVLWKGETIAAVLDFESASRGSLAFDVMVTVLAWCFGDDLDTNLAGSMLAGYAGEDPLTSDLVNELFDAGLLACARFTTTRLTDFELRPRGTTVYKDFRRWRRRMQKLRDLGRPGLLEALHIDPA